MIKLPAQFVKHNGPQVNGEHKLTFDVQKEFSSILYEALEQLERNPQIVLDITIVTTQKEASDITEQLQEKLWTRQNKKIHALIDEIAELRKMKSSDMKKALKLELIKKGTIKESLKELTEDQQGELLNILENDLIEAKFDD